MKLGELIAQRLGEYILANVDQLSEGVTSFGEDVSGGEDEDGPWVVQRVDVTYRVPSEVARLGYRMWWWRGSLESLLRELDGGDQP